MTKRILPRLVMLSLLILLAIGVAQQRGSAQGYHVPGSDSDSCGGGCVNFDDGSPGCASYGWESTGANCAMYWWPGFGMNECRQSGAGCEMYIM